MFKSFQLWVEEKAYKRQVTHMLLRRLGLDKDALKKQSLKLSVLPKDRLMQAIENMPGLSDDKIAELQTWLKHAADATFNDLIAQIGDAVEIPSGEELPGQSAVLPQGQPYQPPQQQQQQQQTIPQE